MQRFAIIITIICVVGCSHQSTTPVASETSVNGILLQPEAVIDGKLTLLVPQEFSIMGEEMLRFKYPGERRPTLVFTDESGGINVAINHTKNRMAPGDVGALHKQMDGMFRNLYPSATWFASDVIDINGREWFTLNLRTPAIDTEIRNIMVGSSLEGRLVLVTFNVTKELEEKWLAPANTIVQSIVITD